MPHTPTGAITFLFTDIEGSTKLWERFPEAMGKALARHDELLRTAIKRHDGYVFKTVGDAFCVAFLTAESALNAALDSHMALLEQEWGETGPLRVRIGLHTGEAEERGADYFGQTLNRVARLQGVGHGQQTLLSQTTYELVSSDLPPSTTLQDMGKHRFKDLSAPEHVWQLLHPSLPLEYPPLKSLDYLPTNLPRQMTSFIGREKEMSEVKRLLQSSPLVTLTGTGGTGKTRLSLQAGADLIEEYSDGVWIAELAGLNDPALTAQTVAASLHLSEEPKRPIIDSLIDFLRDKQILIILDNCEHLLDSCATLANQILKNCQRTTILATSRQALNVPGETVWRIPTLLPPSSFDQTESRGEFINRLMKYDACRLFVERATTVSPGFALTHNNAPILASVCRRLDGIPLALELAAARCRSLSLEEVHNRLDNRFRLLTGGNRAALPRQQTLRALMDWSYDLLSEQEKTLLHRLSVFAGGWTIGTAEKVCAGSCGERKCKNQVKDGDEYLNATIEEWEVLDLLTSLIDKSLAVVEQDHERMRYRLLETVRQYAKERLEESGHTKSLERQHCSFFSALAEKAEPEYTGPLQALWLGEIEIEHDNLRASLDHCLDNANVDDGLKLAGALGKFWWMRGHFSEGRDWCKKVLGATTALLRTLERAKVLHWAGELASSQGDYSTARSNHEDSLSIRKEFSDLTGVATSLNCLGKAMSSQGDFKSANLLYQECLALCRKTGDQRSLAKALGNLGYDSIDQSDFKSGKAYFEESLILLRELGDRSGLAAILNGLGNIARAYQDFPQAKNFYEESLELRKSISERRGVAISIANLGVVKRLEGDYVAAKSHFEESLAVQKELGDRSGAAYTLNELGCLAGIQNDNYVAKSYFEQSLAINRATGNLLNMCAQLYNLGFVAFSLMDFKLSRKFQTECLELRRNLNDQIGILKSLEAFADLAIIDMRWEVAAILQGYAASLQKELGMALSPKEIEEIELQTASARRSLGEERFDSAVATGQALTMKQAIDFALEAYNPL